MKVLQINLINLLNNLIRLMHERTKFIVMQ
jgi:hypothetical protein